MSKQRIIDLTKPIMVSMESQSVLQDAKLLSDDGNLVEITLINCDTFSRNNTYYPLDDVVKSLMDRRVVERFEQRTLFGEAEHPTSENGDPVPLKRLMFVEPKREVWRIDNYKVVGSDIRGVIQWAGPFGAIYKDKVLNHGSNLAASIRAYTPNYIVKPDGGPNGKYTIKKHLMYITTWDCVSLPGLEGSRIMDPAKFREFSSHNKMSVGNKLITSSTEAFREVMFHDPISELRDMMRSQEGMVIVSDMFGVDIDTARMSIIGANTVRVSTESGSSIEVPLSRTITSLLI